MVYLGDTMDRILSLLPSRKFATVIGASCLVVALVAGAYYLPPLVKKQSAQATPPDTAEMATARALMQAAAEKDSDGDGLKDWEEALWHSDPNGRDTDGDGTGDGAEVAQGRDPTKRGDDKVDTSKSPQLVANNNSASSTYSLTDSVAKDLFATYMNAKATGQSLDPDSQSHLISSVLSRHRLPSTAKKYTEIDIQTTLSDNNSIKKYLNELALIFQRYPIKETEIEILNRALQTNSETELGKLTLVEESYRNTLHDLLALPVPREFIQYHLHLINENSLLLQNTSDFGAVFSDPVTALMGLGTSKSIGGDIQANISKMASVATAKGITFSTTDPGYILMRYAQ